MSASEIKGLLNQVKQAAEKLKTKIHDLDDQIETLYTKRSVILSAPLSKEDYLTTIRADIQTKARRFPADLKRHLETESRVNYPAMAQAGIGGLPLRYLDAGNNAGSEMLGEAYYFYFEDVIVEGVERALAGKEWPVDAVPAVERVKSLKVICEQLDTLTQERDSLAGELVSCGVTE